MFSRSLAAVLILILSMDFVAARNLRKRHRHRAPPPAADPKIGAVDTTFSDLRWTSEEGEIRVNGEPFHIKGIAWFGMEDDGASLHGLDKKPMSYIFDFLKKERFNAIRLTVSLEFALHLDADVTNYDHLQRLKDKDLWNLNRGQLLSKVIDKAGEEGFMVVVDMHRLSPYDQGELWYGLGYSEDNFLEGWNRLLKVVGDKWNVMGLDLKNEPRGRSTWGTGQNETDWGMAATRIIKNLTAEHSAYKGLFMVEGVENPTGTWQTSNGRWWGGDLEGIKQNPIDLGTDDINKRIVYAPHIYGPGQYMMDYFTAATFPTNLPTIFDAQWGFAEKLTGRAVVIGEWGGNIGAHGVTGDWARTLVDYMVSHCIADSFFWSLNPDSLDTGGLLKNDWTTPDTGKLSLLSRLQPAPSRLHLTSRDASTNAPTFSFTRGTHADARCALAKADQAPSADAPITSPQP